MFTIRRIALAFGFFLGTVAGTVFVTMQVMPRTIVVGPGIPPVPTAASMPQNAPIPARNAAQADMLKQFRLASPAEASVLQALPVFRGDVAARHIYVANTDFVKLTPVDVPMTLVMPDGHRWESGPLSMITVVRVPTVSTSDLRERGVVYRDPMCTAKRAGIFNGDCTSADALKPGNWDEMLTHMRTPTEAELQAWQGGVYVAGNAKQYLVATSNFVVAPQYQFDGGESYKGIIGIYMPKGVYVLGGQLGYMDLYPVGGPMSVLDSICFMNDASNLNRPQTWAPASEVQRVARCLR